MVNFRGAQFIKSATKTEEAPDKKLSEVIFIGKSNVGKSSLINALCDNGSLCYTSSKPGHTRLLNYFEVLDRCYLVDAPGYGYSKAGRGHADKFATMMEDYFTKNEQLKLVLFLLDSRRELSEDDIDFYKFMLEENLPYALVITKTDKLNQSEKAMLMKRLKTGFTDVDSKRIFLTSCVKKNGLEELKSYICSVI